MEIVNAILQQGGLGLLAAAGFYLYLQERKENKETTKELLTVVKEISVNTALLTEKIETGKRS